jgi:hypothetical protein
LKLAAATDPAQLNGFQLIGVPMPNGLEPLTPGELEALRLWIYTGAPKTGSVVGTDELLGACLPPLKPISIEPLPPPAVDEGVQFVMPPWPLVAQSEFEVLRDLLRFQAVPAEFGPERALLPLEGLRAPPGSAEPSSDPVPAAGERHRGGDRHERSVVRQLDLRRRRKAGNCANRRTSPCGEGVRGRAEALVCVYRARPPASGPAEITGGAPQAQTNFRFPGQVYQQLPLKGVMYWNTHAFNITSRDHVMNGRVNYYFAPADDQRNQACRISDFSAIFRPNNPPFTKETFATTTFPIGSRVFQLSGTTTNTASASG